MFNSLEYRKESVCKSVYQLKLGICLNNFLVDRLDTSFILSV